MNKCKLSIINAVIAGILICGMLAACGAAEKRYAAPEEYKSSETVINVPDHITSTRAKN